MKFAPRAAVSMLMLSGVFALAVAAVLAVSTALVVAASTRGAWAILAAIATAAMIVAIGMGVPAARRRQRKPVEGVLITDGEQPLLWVEICIVAEGLHIWPPSELVLAPDASVTASENRTWLGLRPGVRRLQLGEVLLAGLTERQLRAVIAHELLRFWGPTSSARVIHRGRKVIGRVLDLVGEDSRAGRIVGRFGRMYAAVSDPVIRRHELDEDTRSANLVGNGATSAALREVAVLSKGWDAFVDGMHLWTGISSRQWQCSGARRTSSPASRSFSSSLTGGRSSPRPSVRPRRSLGRRTTPIRLWPTGSQLSRRCRRTTRRTGPGVRLTCCASPTG